ncbi:ATP-binding protein [Sphingomonas sp. CLY1604]|uniref:ATP-binding protein n=1 Tax=Sphingomonas sp. CLY1604 TaxID=3457786 RepID=UPI003FD7B581
MTLVLVALFCAVSMASATSVQGQFDALVADARAAMLSDPHKSVEKAQEAARFADRRPPSAERSLMQGTASWLRGEALMRLNDVRGAEPLVARAVRISTRLAPGSKLQGDALLASGWINAQQGKVAKSLADYQHAYTIFQKLGETRSQAKALQAIGSLYGVANDYVNALRYYEQAIATYRSDPMLSLTLLNNRGNALKDLGRYHEAEIQFRNALKLAQGMESSLLRVLVLGNIAEARLLDHDVRGAERAINLGLALSANGEGGEYRQILIALAARAAYQKGDLRQASRLIGERFPDEDFSKSTLIDREAHRTAYTIYRATGEHDLALQHLVALKRLDDEATTLARSTGAALMAARFDFANQELKIANLQRDEARRSVAYEQARAHTQRTIFLVAAAATAIVVALLGFGLITIRRSRNEVRAANDDLAVTNTALGKALAAKTEFLATTSHEIRTPLNGILGMTQVMLADRSVADATRERLTVVHSAGVTMRALVDDILDVAKMETGNLVIEKAPFDLAAMLAESTRLWEDQAQAKGLTFERDLSACPHHIVGDCARLRQIVFNLMSNALKFTTTGTVTLSAAASADGDRLRIVIADTGVGIEPAKCEEIFESFRQADASTTRQFGGTGLGLSICRNLARAMGGDVAVTSRIGEGSRFTVDLPLIAAPEAEQTSGEAAARPPLLIVDRNPITRSLLKTLMMPHAEEIALAASLAEAEAALAKGGIAGVLVDAAVLPPDDAVAAARRLSDAAGVARTIMLWPAGSDAKVEALAAVDNLTCVIKPVSGASLVATVYPPRDAALVSQAA